MKSAWLVTLYLASACGRVSFDPLTSDASRSGDGAESQTIDCTDMSLGSMVGASVASGTINGAGNQSNECGGMGPDLSFSWFAPASGDYRIDTCSSQLTFDSVLHVYDGSCSGAQIACNDNACGLGGLQSQVTVSLSEGQGIVIVLDAPTLGVIGNYQLSITQL
jgi:hypothetical protein